MPIFQQMTGSFSRARKVSRRMPHMPVDIHYHHPRSYRVEYKVVNEAIRVADQLLSIQD